VNENHHVLLSTLPTRSLICSCKFASSLAHILIFMKPF
jgi:hypothetical protein